MHLARVNARASARACVLQAAIFSDGPHERGGLIERGVEIRVRERVRERERERGVCVEYSVSRRCMLNAFREA